MIKDKNIIQNVVKDLKLCGNYYFEDCTKEKIETISRSDKGGTTVAQSGATVVPHDSTFIIYMYLF